MEDLSPELERLRQSPPPALVAEALAAPGGSVAQIDPAFVEDPNGYVPNEAIQGFWRVDPQGRLTGEFESNPNYGPPQDDFTKLDGSKHYLGWLGDRPAAAIRDSIAHVLDGQAPGAVLEWIKVDADPRYLTSGRPQPGHEEYLIVTRSGLALPFVLSVTAPGRKRAILQGVFTWAAINLDRPRARKDQVWFDLHADLDWAETQLRTRIFTVGTA